MQLARSRTGQSHVLYAARAGTGTATTVQALGCLPAVLQSGGTRTHTPRHKELSTVRQSDPATRIGGDKALVLELTLTARPGRVSVCVLCKECVLFLPFFNGRTNAIRAGLLDGLGLGLPIPGTQVFGCGARIEIGAQYYSR